MSPQGAMQHQRAAEEQGSALEQQVKKLEADLSAALENDSTTKLQMLQAEVEHLRLSAAADAKSMQTAAEDAAR